MRISARKLQNGTIQVAHGEPGWEIVFAEFKFDEPEGSIRIATAWKSADIPDAIAPPATEPWDTEMEMGSEGVLCVAEVQIGNKKFTLPIPVEAKEGQRLFFRMRNGAPKITVE